MLVMYVKDMLNDINPKKKDTEIGNPRWKFCVHSTISGNKHFASEGHVQKYKLRCNRMMR